MLQMPICDDVFDCVVSIEELVYASGKSRIWAAPARAGGSFADFIQLFERHGMHDGLRSIAHERTA